MENVFFTLILIDFVILIPMKIIGLSLIDTKR